MKLRATPAIVAVLAAAVSANAAEIGAVGAVNPATLGEPPALEARQLRISDRIVSDERIIAGENGLAQLMFDDQTTLTVGPNSEVVLDRFVYDPASGAADVALTLARGALRFVGGRATKAAEARIRTNDGVLIGLRGGMASIESSGGETTVVLLAGDYASVESNGETLTLSRPGAVARATSGGLGGVAFGGLIDSAGIGQILSRFASQGDGGGRGGAAPTPVATIMTPGAETRAPVTTTGAPTVARVPAASVVTSPADVSIAGQSLRIVDQAPPPALVP